MMVETVVSQLKRLNMWELLDWVSTCARRAESEVDTYIYYSSGLPLQ